MMSYASTMAEIEPPAIVVEADDPPVRRIKPTELRQLGQNLDRLFKQYASDRVSAEEKWLRNLRQYLGIYDPSIEQQISPARSKAYPRITRVKCISVLSRIMNLMFPGNERNWQLDASPSPDMSPEDVQMAVNTAMAKAQSEGMQIELTEDVITAAVQQLADDRAEQLSVLIDDQLQELGGDQTVDYVALNRKAAQSGILYGLGVLRGPFARVKTTTRWGQDPMTGQMAPQTKKLYLPQFEFLSVWDFYPDLSAKSFATMDGYFVRTVMSRAQVRALANREDFFGSQIKEYLRNHTSGNYQAKNFESELRSMGVKANVNESKAESGKYEVLTWHGPVSGESLTLAGVDVPDDKMADDIEAEIWMIDGNVIKADINPWRKMGVDVRTVHTFLFDEDDTSPVGNGLPNVVRDSQMSVAAAARMLLDNASVVCGPNLEVNTDLMRGDQDLTSTTAYKIWYREGTGQDAQMPAVRTIPIDSHIPELLQIVELFMKFADAETFVGPATGGDMERGSSEPMRSAAGASMMRGDAALPFKDIVRNFDFLTQSVITSLVQFNRKFNPDLAPEGDYNVIARGATSLIAKEVRGMQLDQLAVSLTPQERIHVDDRKLVEARLGVRDLSGLLVPKADAERRAKAAEQAAAAAQAKQDELISAQIRGELADAFKSISQGQKNAAAADAQTVNAAMVVLEKGLDDGQSEGGDKPNGNS